MSTFLKLLFRNRLAAVGAMVLGVIRSGFTYIKLDGSYQLMAMGGIIIAAVVLDQYRQRNRA